MWTESSRSCSFPSGIVVGPPGVTVSSVQSGAESRGRGHGGALRGRYIGSRCVTPDFFLNGLDSIVTSPAYL